MPLPKSLDVTGIAKTVYRFFVGSAEKERLPVGTSYAVISKRCVKCGIRPHQENVEEVFGQNWQQHVYCTVCRETLPPWSRASEGAATIYSKCKVYVAFAYKLEGIPTDKIKEWYVPIALRRKCRDLYIKTIAGDKIYISDGYRFWSWLNYPYNMQTFLNWDEFQRANTDWELVE